jgi:hypothetical protein
MCVKIVGFGHINVPLYMLCKIWAESGCWDELLKCHAGVYNIGGGMWMRSIW